MSKADQYFNAQPTCSVLTSFTSTLYFPLYWSKILGPPLEKVKIVGDGNCLFRALLYVITGSQSYHEQVRSKIIEHMEMIATYLKPHLNCSLNHYLQNSRMRNLGTWGTDRHFRCCIFTKHRYICDIYIPELCHVKKARTKDLQRKNNDLKENIFYIFSSWHGLKNILCLTKH